MRLYRAVCSAIEATSIGRSCPVMTMTTTDRLIILAARLRVTLDRRLGRATPAHVIALAKRRL